jgi:hypothetical protein
MGGMRAMLVSGLREMGIIFPLEFFRYWFPTQAGTQFVINGQILKCHFQQKVEKILGS